MTRILLLLLLVLLFAGVNPGFSAQEEPTEQRVEMSNEDREIAELLELLELMELLNDMEDVAALEENQ